MSYTAIPKSRRLAFRLGRASAVVVVASVVPSLYATETDRPSVRLQYERGEGAQQCPDESYLRSAVAIRLGYDPFVDNSERTLVASVQIRGSRLFGQIEERTKEGKASGRRALDAGEDSCQELITSLAVALAVAIDPLSLTRPEAAPSGERTPEPPPPPPAASSPAPHVLTWVPPPQREQTSQPQPTASSAPPSVVARLSGLVSLGTAPDPAWGASVSIGLRWQRSSLNLEGRADWLSEAEVDGYHVKSSLTAGGLSACMHWSYGMGCGIVLVGSQQAQSQGLREPSRDRDRASWGAAGARLGVEVPVGWRLTAHGTLDLLGSWARNTFYVNEKPIWTSPPVACAVGLGLGSRF